MRTGSSDKIKGILVIFILKCFRKIIYSINVECHAEGHYNSFSAFKDPLKCKVFFSVILYINIEYEC